MRLSACSGVLDRQPCAFRRRDRSRTSRMMDRKSFVFSYRGLGRSTQYRTPKESALRQLNPLRKSIGHQHVNIYLKINKLTLCELRALCERLNEVSYKVDIGNEGGYAIHLTHLRVYASIFA